MTVPRRPNQVVIKVSQPYPLLDSGEYAARCIEATFDWSQSLRVWKAILTFGPAQLHRQAVPRQTLQVPGSREESRRPLCRTT